MKNILSEKLKNTPIFSELTFEELDACANLVREVNIKKGTTIFHEGQPGVAFYVINSGRVKISKLSEDGRELILGVFQDNALFGDVPVFDGGPYPATATALTGVKVYSIDRKDFEELVVTHPQIALKMIRFLGKRLRHAHGFVVDIAMKTVPQRLALLLIRLADEYGRSTPAGVFLDISLTRQEIGEMIGSSRETAIRELSKFCRAGVIEMNGREIIIKDISRLRMWS